MTARNAEIADAFNRLAELLEIEGANPFRVRAYRNAARTVAELPRSVADMLAAGDDLTDLPGIGEDLAGKIREIVESGHLSLLENERRKLPRSLVELATLPGMGPKRIKLVHDRLGVASLAQLRRAIDGGKLAGLHGFGPKSIEKLADALRHRVAEPKRNRLADTTEVGEALAAYLRRDRAVGRAEIAGSYRRRKDTIGDLDILATSHQGAKVIERFVAFPEIAKVISKGSTRSTVILRSGIQVDLRVVEEESYGAALHYFTGSKPHNIAIRERGVARGLKINEYGVFKGERRIAGRTEAEVYRAVGLPYIEPELREGRGEIEAAEKKRLPHLVGLGDIRGDLHAHTSASDGRNSIAEMAKAAKAKGYAYLAISDHSQHTTIAHGLDARRLARQLAEIDRLNDEIDGIRILKSAEVDILGDGRLDFPDSSLERLDFTICAIHSQFGLPPAKQTERIIRAMDNPNFGILAHPTGRLINERPGYGIDMERVIEAAKERGCFLEINAQPERLDLDDVHGRLAKEIGVKLAISTDAHSTAQLDFMRFGIDQARRAWLAPEDVLNTRPWAELRKLLRRR
jgi:DNA polymerase (family 10)